jgi:hypothetical protein
MKRHPEIQKFVNAFASEIAFGRNPQEAIAEGICVACGSQVYDGNEHEFRDEESIHEYDISGLCQKCQDQTFGDEGLQG